MLLKRIKLIVAGFFTVRLSVDAKCILADDASLVFNKNNKLDLKNRRAKGQGRKWRKFQKILQQILYFELLEVKQS